MKQSRKIYAPVTEFERATSYCPLYLAWRIVDGARDYFRTPIPEAFADKLARRAQAVFARYPFWQRRFQSMRGREFILMSMRHWLAGMLAQEHPTLFRDLPESFKIGHPLPEMPRSRGRQSAPSNRNRFTSPATVPRMKRGNFRPRFVHGCELLVA
ncbi:MAG: hypothetical protein WAO02_12190 [Verrucomicrobiia bacterium]